MTTQNSLNNETYDAPFVANSRPAGAVAQIISRNNDNTNAGSSAFVASSVAGAVAGDPYMLVQVAGATAFSWGIDNSDSDTLKESTGAVSTPSSGTTLRRMTTAGVQTMPLQPSFFAFVTGTLANVTGAGAIVDPVIFGTESYDIGGNYNNATGVFTAPVDGTYLFTYVLYFLDLTAAMTTGGINLNIDSGTAFLGAQNYNIGAARTLANEASLEGNVVIRLTAGQTVNVRVAISNGAGNTADILGSSAGAILSHFSGCLLF